MVLFFVEVVEFFSSIGSPCNEEKRKPSVNGYAGRGPARGRSGRTHGRTHGSGSQNLGTSKKEEHQNQFSNSLIIYLAHYTKIKIN
jgi:hypothetical protein